MDKEGINNDADHVLAKKTHGVENGDNVLVVIDELGMIKRSERRKIN